MKYLFTLVFISNCIFLQAHNGYSISARSNVVSQVETKFVIIELPKYEKAKLQELVAELYSYVGKIADVQFVESTQQLTVLYYSTVTLDDIFQIVGKYFPDFNKISGSELE
jgi:hypothetical protein